MKNQLLLLIIALLPMLAYADESGMCGDNVTWSFDWDTQTLTISGTGEMDGYYTYNGLDAPWYSFRESITTAVIEDGVTSIGSCAFRDCGSLTSITIPTSVTSIGEWAFYGCIGLSSVDIPNSLTRIEEYAFRDCSSLTSFIIPNSVTSIGNLAFEGCSSLTAVNIPSSVTSIGDEPFASCNLESITVDEDNPIYDSRNDCNAIIETATNKLISGCKNTKIGKWDYIGLESIGDYAFYGCKGLTFACITNRVSSIGDYAFQNCSDLTEIWFSGFPLHIGLGAFLLTAWYNSQPDGLIYVGSDKDIAYSYKGTMPDNTSLSIKDGTRYIADGAFYNCSGLTSITIPNNVSYIGRMAFKYCRNLKSITIPNSVYSIEEGTFAECSSLESIILPNSLTKIEDDVFAGCGLTTITIPDGVTSIGDDAFYCCHLQDVTIPNSVTEIGDYAFSGCSDLSSVSIPNSVTSIGANAFYYCRGLISATIGSGTTCIGSQAFASCSKLTDVYCWAENVPSTDSDAFKDAYINYSTLHVPYSSVEAYGAVEPWKNFKKTVAIDGSEPPYAEKCSTPTISIVDGGLTFSCETEDVEFIYEITAKEVKEQSDGKIALGDTYIISVYATKAGYEDSDVVTKDIELSAGAVGDVNGDGVIDVSDYIGVANIILTGNIRGE